MTDETKPITEDVKGFIATAWSYVGAYPKLASYAAGIATVPAFSLLKWMFF